VTVALMAEQTDAEMVACWDSQKEWMTVDLMDALEEIWLAGWMVEKMVEH
jgi:hypothetical protein